MLSFVFNKIPISIYKAAKAEKSISVIEKELSNMVLLDISKHGQNARENCRANDIWQICLLFFRTMV